MTLYGGPDLANAFRTVRKNTVQIAEEIPEDKYDFVAAPGVRSVSEMLRHIIHAPELQEDMHRVKRITTFDGYNFGAGVGAFEANAAKPRTKAQIISDLKSHGERLATWMESLTPEYLAERVSGGAGAKSRLEGLMGIKE